MMSKPSKDFNIAVIGGGMSGLACAARLLQDGLDVTVFEAAHEFGEIGAGVGIGPNGIRALRELGLLDSVLSKVDSSAPDMRGIQFLSGMGEHEVVIEPESTELTRTVKDKSVGIYRPDFIDAILPLIDPKHTQLNKRCIRVSKTPTGRHRVFFADGTTFDADLVIGADGVKSNVRKAIIGDVKAGKVLRFLSTFCYRALLPMEIFGEERFSADIRAQPFVWIGLGKCLVTYPIKGGKFLNLGAFAQPSELGDEVQLLPERPQPWVEFVPAQELQGAFKDWGNDPRKILSYVTNPSRYSIHTVDPPLESYVKDRVVVVGDAAHAMTSHLAAGVGQGFEDVRVLCKLLTLPETRKSNLDDILGIYNQLRPPRANKIVEGSLRNARTYCSYGPGKYSVEEMHRNTAGVWGQVWAYDLEAPLSAAIAEKFPRYRTSQSKL